MNVYVHAISRVGLAEWPDLVEGSMDTLHFFARSPSLNRRLINISEAVACIIRCGQFHASIILYARGGSNPRTPNLGLNAPQIAPSVATRAKHQ